MRKKTAYFSFVPIIIVLLLLMGNVSAQIDTSKESRYSIFLSSGVSASGSKIGIKYNLTHKLSFEAALGVGFNFIPFWAAVPTSNDHLYSAAVNIFPFDCNDYLINIASIFVQTNDRTTHTNYFLMSYSIGYMPRVKNNMYSFIKIGCSTDKNLKFDIIPNLEFGIGYQF